MIVYTVHTSKGTWDSYRQITIAICSTMWEAEKKREEWMQMIKPWESKYSKEDREKLDKEWEELPSVEPHGEYPEHLLEYNKWLDDTGHGSEYEKYSEQVDITEIELDKILYKPGQ